MKIEFKYAGKDLEEPRIKEYVVYINGIDVAALSFFITEDGQAMVYNLFVEERHRRKGYGSAIIRKLGVEVTALDVLVKAVDFWKRLGATIIMHPYDKG